MKSLLIRLIKKLGDMRRHLLYYRIWPAVYRRAAKKPIDEKKVLLASNSRTLPDNLSCMKRELEARGMHCTEMLIPAGAGSISARVAEFRQNIRFQREYATSKLVFVEDAFFPLFANHPRKGTEVIQLWHACGAFKNGAIRPPTSSGARTERASNAIRSTTPIPQSPCRRAILFRIMPRRSTARRA